MTADRRQDILRKVRALVDKANGTQYDAERDAFLAKADALMAAYAIEAFELEFAKPANARIKPVVADVPVPKTGDSDGDYDMRRIFQALASHCGVLFGKWNFGKDQTATVVGYEADVEYLELLTTNVALQLAATISPRPDPNLDTYTNVAVLKHAGLGWDRIYELMLPLEPAEFDLVKREDGTYPPAYRGCPYNLAVKLSKGYTAWARRHGETRVTSNPKSYRANFRDGYMATLRSRIYDLTRAREKAGVGHEVVLAGREDALKEAFYDRFPERRPHPAECECDPCHVVKCNDPKCERERCKQARKPVRMGRTYYRAYDALASQAGRKAAANVDLSGGRRDVGGTRGAIG